MEENTQIETTENLDNSNDVSTEPAGETGAENTEAPENAADNSEEQKQEPELLGKFKSQEELVKAYQQLEKLNGQQSNELGDLRKKAELADKLQEQINSQKLAEANNKGFETVKEYENHKELNKFVADAYRKHLDECEFPDEMENLLKELEKSSSNSKELIETIESQFSLDTIKAVAIGKDKFNGQLEEKELQAQKDEIINSAKNYLNETVNKHLKEFENPAFNELFGEAFLAYGETLQTDRLINLLHQYVDYVNKANGIESSIYKQNSEATDEISGASNTGGGKGGESGGNLLDLSEEQAANRLAQLI